MKPIHQSRNHKCESLRRAWESRTNAMWAPYILLLLAVMSWRVILYSISEFTHCCIVNRINKWQIFNYISKCLNVL